MKLIGLIAAAGMMAFYVSCGSNGSKGSVSDTVRPGFSLAKNQCQLEDFLGGRADSNFFSLTAEEVYEINPDDAHEELASHVVSEIGVRKGCDGSDGRVLKIDHKYGVGCKWLLEDEKGEENMETQVCVVSTNLGQFFVIPDPLGGLSIVFHRQD
jgi:hypothetical protein